MNSKVNNILATSVIPFIYGIIVLSMLRDLPQFGEVVFALSIIIAVFRSYFTYKLNNTSLVIALAIVYGEIILVSMSYATPLASTPLPLCFVIGTAGYLFRRYAKKIA